MIDPVYGCDLVTNVDKGGYGRERGKLTHVAAWEAVHGPVPKDKTLDHLCRRRACRLLAHLEAVTRTEQERRKSWRYRAKRKTCAAGHSLDQERMVTPEGGVVCRRCSRPGASRSEGLRA